MTMQRLLGLETEYAIAPLPDADDRGSASGGALDLSLDGVVDGASAALSARLLAAIGPGGRRGFFLSNGARLYRDGAHVEYATPETTHPADLVCHVLAGDQLVHQGLQRVDAEHGGGNNLRLYKSNQSYGRQPAVFGCHENYGYVGVPADLHQRLIPFLCSRVIFTGAGGYINTRPLQFSLSPRANVLSGITGENERLLINGRDEPLTNGQLRRLHLNCGESLCSHLGMYLKLGVTAIAVTMAEAGLDPGEELMPADVLAAMRQFAADPSCSVTVPGQQEQQPLSAIQIQRAYLRAACDHVDDDWMPPWAYAVVDRWREILDLLESGAPESVATRLDWAIKWRLHETHCLERGFDPADLPAWDCDLSAAARLYCSVPWCLKQSDAQTLVRHQRVLDEVVNPWPLFQQRDPKWERLSEILALRSELFEIDTRFAEIGADGLFGQLDAADVLDHRIPEVSDPQVRRAIEQAPQDTRACVRGRTIERLSRRRPKKADFQADWHRITRSDDRVVLDMGDPWNLSPCWQRRLVPTEPTDPFASAPPPLQPVDPPEFGVSIDDVIEAYQGARFADAHLLARRLVDACERHGQANRMPQYASPWIRAMRYLAWTTARLGLGDPLPMLASIYGEDTTGIGAIGDHLFVYRQMRLSISPEMEAWVQAAAWLHLRCGQLPSDIVEPLGYRLLMRGELEEARRLLEPYAGVSEQLRGMRLRDNLFNVYLRLGDRERAEGMFASMYSHEGSRLIGTAAAHLFPAQAKLADRPACRRRLLSQAYDLHRRSRHHFGMVKASLMCARACNDRATADHLRQRVLHDAMLVPALLHCPKFDQIQHQWVDWTETEQPDEHGDYWWGL